MDGCIGCMDICIDEHRDVWMNEWIYGYMSGCRYVCPLDSLIQNLAYPIMMMMIMQVM